MPEYKPTIGIECHVQLKTKTKLFAAVDNDAREASPNTLISHICLGMPGALPVLNQGAVNDAMRVAFAFNTKPQRHSYFERKHYFYPDLPKGYQITQLAQPIIAGGYVEIEVNGNKKHIRVNRVQLEEDAGKSTHPAGKDYSLVDLNRAGTPLLEIVSEPDIHSAEEAKAYARELWLLMRYTGVSDADMYHGNMRFDVNVSVSSDPNQLGTRTETKNLNSFRSVERAVAYEIKRQTELLQKGEKIVQETRGWHDAKQKTFSQRGKEEAHDYRYFPDPDLPPVEITDAMASEVQKTMPVLPAALRQKLAALGLDTSATETLLENQALLNVLLSEENQGADKKDLKRIADWLVNTVVKCLNDDPSVNPSNIFKHPGNLTKLSQMVEKNVISATAAKGLIVGYYADFTDPEALAKENNLLQISDESEIARIVEKVIAENPKAAEDIKKGEARAIGFLVGQVMKESKGQANPGLVQQLIKRQL